MRLAVIDRGQSLKHKLMFGIARAMSGHRVPDVVRTLLYRGDYFGQRMNVVFQEAMRGPSPWTAGERELMAAYVSHNNQCEF
jgi:hypothetical protein